jgi:hypothetical protein
MFKTNDLAGGRKTRASRNWRDPTVLAKIFGIFKKIKSLSARSSVIKDFGENFIFPFTPLHFWQIFSLFSDFFGIFPTLARKLKQKAKVKSKNAKLRNRCAMVFKPFYLKAEDPSRLKPGKL